MPQQQIQNGVPFGNNRAAMNANFTELYAAIATIPPPVATDTIWAAAGDLVVGTGSHTATVLSKGSPLTYLRVNAAGTGLEYGTPGGGGTVTNTGGALASNALLLGAGGSDSKAAAGFSTDGVSKLTLGVAGTSVGALVLANATSGSITISPPTGALGTVTLTAPAATDTLVGRATTDTLTNKTFDTAGAGNVFKINGTAISTITGTGAAVLANSPTLVAPALGTPTSGNLANCSGYPADASKASVTQSLTKSFFVPSPVDGVIVYLPVEEGMTITKITAKTGSGTCTLTAAINGTNITGTAVSASSTKSSQTYSAGNVANAGTDFTITASGSASPVNLGVTVVYTRTLS